jgi:hypothetical protein
MPEDILIWVIVLNLVNFCALLLAVSGDALR